MRTRPLVPTDLPALKRMAAESGYPYPDLSSAAIESVYVVVDEADQPVMACAVERIVQLFLFVPQCPGYDASCPCQDGDACHYRGANPFKPMNPAAKLHALRLLHEAMAPDLQAKGYTEVNAFIPPTIAAKFGRRLMRSFGWVKNWPSFCRHL